MNRFKTTVRSALFALLVGLLGTPIAAQTEPDSIAAWVTQLRTGSLQEKVEAAGKLAQENPTALPPAAQEAIVQELERINQALFSTGTGPGAAELGEETFGEYYLDLVLPTAHFSSPEAMRALVRSVGVGGGIQRRVARQGDPVIPALVGMIQATYQSGDALATLGLAWFWADSTGAALSDRSRGLIIQALLAAMESDDYTLRRNAVVALGYMSDPSLHLLAQSFLSDAEVRNQILIVRALRRETLPALSDAESKLTALQLAERSARAVSAVCEGVTAEPKRGVCTSLGNELRAAFSHLRNQRLLPARNILSAAQQRADQASRNGTLSSLEHALISGSVQLVLDRLPL